MKVPVFERLMIAAWCAACMALFVLAIALVFIGDARAADGPNVVGGTGAVPTSRVAIPQRSARYRIALEREVGSQFGLDAPVARIAAQIHQESGWRADAASPYAQGLAQFTPSTAAWLPDVCPEVGPPDAWDAGWSIRAIACYDAWLHSRVSGATACDRWAFTLSAYNGGLGWIARDQNRASDNGSDPARWFDSVERFSARSRAATTENRTYVRRILLQLEPAYVSAGWNGKAVCL